MNETVEICSVVLDTKLIGDNNIPGVLTALMSFTRSLACTLKLSELRVTIPIDGSNKRYLIAEIGYQLSSIGGTTKSGSSSCGPKTSSERLLPRRVVSGDDTGDQQR